MSLENDIKELRGAITVLTQAMLKLANEGVPTLQADSEQALDVPKFLRKGEPDLVTKKDEGPGLITDDAGMSEETDLTPRQIAAKKGSKTRAANKAKKEAERQAAKEGAEKDESERLAEFEEVEESFLPEEEEDEDFPGFLEEPEEETDPFFAEAAAEAETSTGLSVMGEDDPKGALRKYLVTISKAFQTIGNPEGLAKLLQNKEAGFGYISFNELPEEQFDSFLNAALNELPANERAKIG